MSTRWYPIYQRGNPQLRVFLPNFWMKLIKPMHEQPKNVVMFHCSMEMTQHDITSYLKKIYNINIININTRIALGKTKKEKLQGSIVKEDDRKLAYITLPDDETFVFPDLFKDAKDELDDKMIDEPKQEMQQYLNANKAPGLPSWFRI